MIAARVASAVSPVTGGVAAGVITIVALIGWGLLCRVLVKRDQGSWFHMIAAMVFTLILLLTPFGRLGYQFAVQGLDQFI